MNPLKILLPSHETLSIVFAPHAPEMKKRRKKNVRTCAAQRRRNRRLQSVGPLLPAGAPPPVTTPASYSAPPPAAAAGHHRCPCLPPPSKTAAAVDLLLGVLQQWWRIQVPHMPHLILYIVIPFPSSPFPSLLGFGRTLCLRRRPARHQQRLDSLDYRLLFLGTPFYNRFYLYAAADPCWGPWDK